MRIVSLLPCATEIVCALGLGDQLVGTSHECDFPEFVADLPAVTETIIDRNASSAEIDRQVREQLVSQQPLYSLREQTLAQLRPDLIVTQSLCDVCAVAHSDVVRIAAALPEAPQVFNLESMTLEDMLDSLTALADVANVADAGQRLRAQLEERIENIRLRTLRLTATEIPRVAFLEWLDPPFFAGHWNPALIELAGGISVLGSPGAASSTTSITEIAAADPDALIVACCGFDITQCLHELAAIEHTAEWQALRAVRASRVFVVDGNAYFNRPGPRLVDSLELLAHTLHPTHHTLPAYLSPATKRPTPQANPD